MRLVLRGDILVRDEVHTVTRRRNDADVGEGIVGKESVEVKGLVLEVDWLVVDRTELSVNRCSQLFQLAVNDWVSFRSCLLGTAICTSTTFPTHSGCFRRNCSKA